MDGAEMSASCRHTTEQRQNSIPVVSTTDTYFDNPLRTRSQLHPVAGVGKGSVSARFQQIQRHDAKSSHSQGCFSGMSLIPLSRRMLHAPHPPIHDTQPRGCSPFSSRCRCERRRSSVTTVEETHRMASRFRSDSPERKSLGKSLIDGLHDFRRASSRASTRYLL